MIKIKIKRKFDSLVPLNPSMAVCVWDADDKTLDEQFSKGRQPVLTFALLPTEQICTVFFPVEYLGKSNALSLANNIGKVVADELLLCGLKLQKLPTN